MLMSKLGTGKSQIFARELTVLENNGAQELRNQTMVHQPFLLIIQNTKAFGYVCYQVSYSCF